MVCGKRGRKLQMCHCHWGMRSVCAVHTAACAQLHVWGRGSRHCRPTFLGGSVINCGGTIISVYFDPTAARRRNGLSWTPALVPPTDSCLWPGSQLKLTILRKFFDSFSSGRFTWMLRSRVCVKPPTSSKLLNCCNCDYWPGVVQTYTHGSRYLDCCVKQWGGNFKFNELHQLPLLD